MQPLKAHLNQAISELDKTLAILGLFLTSFLAIWILVNVESLMNKVAAVIAVLACAGYLAIRKRLHPSKLFSSAQTSPNSSLRMILNILFFLFLSCSVLLIYLSPELYIRPLGYFVFMALMVTILALEIFLLPSEKKWTYFTLLKVMLIGLSVEWSLLLMFPNVVGIDPWFHQSFTLELLEAEHIPGWSSYAKFPFTHLLIGVTSLITGVSYKIASMLSVSLLQMISSVLFIFLLGRLIYNDKVGLAAALFLGIANEHLHWGFWIIPMIAGAILILPIIYLLFKTRQEKPVIAIFLFLLLTMALVLTHTITAACMAMLLFICWIGFEVHKRICGVKSAVPVTLNLAALFSVAMLGWWMYAAKSQFITFVGLFQSGFGKESWGTPVVVEAKEYMLLNVPPSEWIFGTLGMVLFFTFSIIGCFYMLSLRFGNRYSFVMAIGGLILLTLGFLAPNLDIWILEERWHYFAQIALAIPFGVATVLIFGEVLKNKLIKILFIAFFSFIISFLMIMSPDVSMDNRTFTPNTAIRYAYTESEQQAVSTISVIWDGKTGTDNTHTVVGTLHYINIDKSLSSGDFGSHRNTLIVIREEIVNYPFGIRRGMTKLHYDPYCALEEQGFARIYDCGSVRGFIKP